MTIRQTKLRLDPKRNSHPATSASTLNYRLLRSTNFDRLADAELQHGHHHAAEHLASRAQELREAGR